MSKELKTNDEPKKDMLTCAEDERPIISNFSLVYLLGTNENGLVRPFKKLKLHPPNAAIHNQHQTIIPEGILVKDPSSIDGEVYAIYEGIDDGTPAMGCVSIFGAQANLRRAVYLNRTNMGLYLPKALEVIAQGKVAYERKGTLPPQLLRQ